jgi:hypothetical protein
MKKSALLIPALLFASILPPAGAADDSATVVTGLRCEGAVDPLGLDAQRPRLSWRMEADRNGAAQTAYQIEVDGAWDSGKVLSDTSIAIRYAGAPLESGKTYAWRVRLWDEQGRPTAWSAPARWTMGKLSPADWSARWIAAPAEIPFTVEGVEIVRATYRTLDGKVEVDVTSSVRKLVAEKRVPFPVEPGALGGDPALNIVKELVVEYTRDGSPGVSRARDFQPLNIPQVPAGVSAPWFRGEFELPDAADSALLTIHSPAYFELYVNGIKVGPDVLMPAVSDSRDLTFTVTYDVKPLLQPGKNCIGIWAAKGWAKDLVLRAQLDAMAGGRAITFGTGPDWKTRPSGYRHIGRWNWGDFGGELVDAGHHLPGWAKPGLDTRGWATVIEAAAPAGAPVNHLCPPNRIGKTIAPAAIVPLAGGRYEIDFGTNLTGWLRLKLPGLKAGQVVRMHFADRVFPDGVHASPIGNININGGSCVSFARAEGGHNLYQTYKQTSEFVSAGVPGEEFQHKFNYAGFRYVVVEGLAAAPAPGDAISLLVESALPDAGSFECSDPLLNRIHQVNRWTQRCLNLGGYYVDCPHRERMGYGDGQVALQGMMMNFDAAHYYAKWVRDWRMALERKHEHLPYIAPPFEKTGGGPPWPGNIVRIPWWHYLHYGDPAILEENIDAAKRYCEYLDSRSTGDVLRAWGGGFSFIGDWVPPNRGMDTSNWPTPGMAEFFCNVYRVHLWQLVGNMAAALGRTSEAEHARARADAIGKATHAAFFDAANKRYVIDEQIYYAFPLLVGITPEAERAAVLDNLIRCIVDKNKGHLDTGMLGTLLLIEFLAGDRPGRPHSRHVSEEGLSRLGLHGRAGRHHPVGAMERPLVADSLVFHLGRQLALPWACRHPPRPRTPGVQERDHPTRHRRRHHLGAGHARWSLRPDLQSLETRGQPGHPRSRHPAQQHRHRVAARPRAADGHIGSAPVSGGGSATALIVG